MNELNKPQHETGKSAIEDSLTAYVQGRLDDMTVRRIEARAQSNEVFAEKLAFEKRIADVIRDPDSARSLDSNSYAALRERIEAPSLRERLKRLLAPSVPAVRWAAASILVMLGAGVLLWSVLGQNMSGLNEFETLTTPGETVTMLPDRYYARVIFVPGLSAMQREQAAEQWGFEIVAGPGPLESFTVRLADGGDSDIDATIAQWCDDVRISFCQRIVRD